MEVYLNHAQSYLVAMSPNTLVACCGRGFGKGVLQAERMRNCMQLMPRSTGGMVGPSVKRLLTNILPSAITHWERWGFKRDVHYCIGHAPARAWHWERPVITPQNYENTVSFYNGSTIQLISQDRAGSSNSLSLDWLSVDEAKFINYGKFKDETLPANRGQEMFFGKCHLHHGMTITSDMPLTKAGSWFMKYSKDVDPELVAVVEGLVSQRYIMAERLRSGIGSRAYNERVLRQTERDLEFFRRRLLLYKEYTSIENLQVLGEAYIRQMKRDLPPLTFATSIMCQRIGIVTDGFYGAMKESNKYTAPAVSFIDDMEYDTEKLAHPDSRWDADIDPQKPLLVAFDANANINWMVVGQLDTIDGRRVLKVVKSLFVKFERKLPELIHDFCEYFRYHRFKKVVFYYDSTFVGNNYALHNDDFHNFIASELRRSGWIVQEVYIGKVMKHVQKQILISRMLKGEATYKVLINKDNNEDLLISIQSAGIYNGCKDKRGEKLAETEEDKLESRTDGSDAFDTLCIGAERFPRAAAESNAVVSSIRR